MFSFDFHFILEFAVGRFAKFLELLSLTNLPFNIGEKQKRSSRTSSKNGSAVRYAQNLRTTYLAL